MNINYINTGTSLNSGDGDSIRTAFSKVNSNLSVIASSLTNLSALITSIGPTGPTGPAGSSGVVNTGSQFSISYYSSTSSVLSPSPLRVFPNIVNFGAFGNSGTSLLEFGDSIFRTPQIRIVRNSLTVDPLLLGSSRESSFLLSEHHDEQDVSNFTFYRTRGTSQNQLPLRNGDDVGEISFLSTSKNQVPVVLGTIVLSIENTATTFESARLKIFVNDGNFGLPIEVAEFDASGTLKVDKIGELNPGANISIKNNVLPSVDLDKNLGTTLYRWNEGFLNVLNLSSGITFADGSTQTTAWTPSSSYSSRTTKTITTPPLNPGDLIDVTLDGFPGFVIYKISTSAAAWIRLYTSESARLADASRIEGVSPQPESGIIAEISSTSTSTVKFLPAIYGFTDPPLSEIKANIVNKSVTTSSITLSVIMVQTES